ncbi:hypothetical protein MNBD_GAMMA03-1929 [hydrothermal vent metagenome]|uniref:Outer membrane lipoprotein carrier protein LolA n=1 Tax=hydrothermal vent metagenome TaxID=652676 RepID=A0A3B0W115_9ZZZZ
MFKPLLFISLIFIVCGFSSVAHSNSLTLESLFSAFKQIKSQQKNFTEEQIDPILDIRIQKSGYLIYQSPENLTLHYLTPIKGSIIFTPNQVKIDFPRRTVILSPDDAPQMALSQTILHLLNGNLKQLSTNFTLQFSPQSNQTWQLNLIPKNATNNYFHPIQIRGVQKQMTEIVMTDRTGESRKISFEKLLPTP